MSTLLKLTYIIDSTIEYKESGYELVPAAKRDVFDADGNPLQIYYKRQKFPEVLVTIGNITKTLLEISTEWKKFDTDSSRWCIRNEEGISLLSINTERWSSESAIEFITMCDRFVKEMFHL